MLVGCFAGGVVIAVLGWLFPSVTAAGESVRGVTTNAFAFTSLLTIPVFSQMWVYAVSIAVSFIVSMVLIIMLDYRTPEQKAEMNAASESDGTAVETAPADAAPVATATATATATAVRTTTVGAPVAGHVVSLDDAGDPAFASRALGEGVGIQPTDSTVVAPVSGVLQTVAETGHAFGLKTDDGIEVLVHVGIDTVKMNGEGFHVAVSANQRVNAGDTLVTVDFDKVKEAGYSTTTLMTGAEHRGACRRHPEDGRGRAGGPGSAGHPALTASRANPRNCRVAGRNAAENSSRVQQQRRTRQGRCPRGHRHRARPGIPGQTRPARRRRENRARVRSGDGRDPDHIAELLSEIPPEIIRLVTDAMTATGLAEQAESQPTLVMALADHITGAVQRAQRHVNIAYPLQAEVQSLYASEYAQASRLVNELNRHLNGVLPGSETVALALHLVNAGFANGDLSDTYKMTGVIQQMLTIIEQTYGVSLDQHSVNVGRFITHLRYLFVRIHQGKQLDKEPEPIIASIRQSYPKAMQCAQTIGTVASLRLGSNLTEDEVAVPVRCTSHGSSRMHVSHE